MADITDYKQYDARWAGEPYAGGNIANSGCGGASTADIISRANPSNACGWLTAHGYACSGYGTYWGGIPAVLQGYGIGANQLNFTSLYGVHSSAVFSAWKEQIQAGYCGVLLMGKSMWTNGGHYIAIVGYQNGLYRVFDPASEARTGWHSWSDFAGYIKVLYTTQKKWKDSPEPEPWKAIGTATCTDNGVNVRVEPDGAVIGTLNTGQRFEIDGVVKEGYTHVKIAGIGIAWVATKYVKKDTPTPSPTYEYSFSVPGLRKGTNSRAVTLFERLLAPKYIYKGVSDTIYGDGCVAACKKVQALHNMAQNGNCYLTEWKYITGLPNEGSKFFLQKVSKGSQGASVVFVQLILRAFGYEIGAVDGVCGNNTTLGIKKFQQIMRLPETGVADKATLAKMVGF